MEIGEIQRVTDLAEGEGAVPENGIAYRLRSINNTSVDTDVEFVVRRGDQLIARGNCGNDFRVSGLGSFVLTPRTVAALR